MLRAVIFIGRLRARRTPAWWLSPVPPSLVHSGLQIGSGGEARDTPRANLERAAIAGIAHTARLAIGDVECAEAGERDAVATRQAGLNSRQASLQRAGCLR